MVVLKRITVKSLRVQEAVRKSIEIERTSHDEMHVHILVSPCSVDVGVGAVGWVWYSSDDGNVSVVQLGPWVCRPAMDRGEILGQSSRS